MPRRKRFRRGGKHPGSLAADWLSLLPPYAGKGRPAIYADWIIELIHQWPAILWNASDY
jgi:hypothetical protein